jgi:hypothetical protein
MEMSSSVLPRLERACCRPIDLARAKACNDNNLKAGDHIDLMTLRRCPTS